MVKEDRSFMERSSFCMFAAKKEQTKNGGGT